MIKLLATTAAALIPFGGFPPPPHSPPPNSHTGSLGCNVTIRVARGVDYSESTGTLTFRQTGKGYDYAELDGILGQGTTGEDKFNTIMPPLNLTINHCP